MFANDFPCSVMLAEPVTGALLILRCVNVSQNLGGYDGDGASWEKGSETELCCMPTVKTTLKDPNAPEMGRPLTEDVDSQRVAAAAELPIEDCSE
jgi:hypothetical protein